MGESDLSLSFLPYLDRIPLRLRHLYESYGYVRYKMDKFETYDIYHEHRSFLTGDGVITFTGPEGRLMALKPDVTISIIKNTSPGETKRRLFYIENVFRLDPRQKEFCEVNQIGLEFIGAGGGYPEAEVVSLAARSLACIDSEYLLNIGHMGLLAGFLEYAGLEVGPALELISRKNSHELERCAQERGLDLKTRELLCRAAKESYPIENLEALRQFAVNETAEQAFNELSALSEALADAKAEKNIRFDFSAVENAEYYNGIVLKGYVKKAGRAVLGGGRYDNLMKRFGKERPAVGFALYLSELEQPYYAAPDKDAGIALVYGDAPSGEILRTAQLLRNGGRPVACSEDGTDLPAQKAFYIDKEGNLTDADGNTVCLEAGGEED